MELYFFPGKDKRKLETEKESVSLNYCPDLDSPSADIVISKLHRAGALG